MLLSFFSAILAVFTYPPFGIYGLAFVFLVPYFWFLTRESRMWRLILGTLIFRLTTAGLIGLEAYEPLLFLQSASLFLVLPVFLWIFKRLSFRENIQLAILPVLYMMAEYMQAQFTLLPSIKAYIGVNLAPSPFLGLARWGGVLLLSFFAASINALIVASLRRSRWGTGKFLKSKFPRFDSVGRGLLAAAAGTIVLGLLLSNGGLRERKFEYQARENTLRVALVSTASVFDNAIEDFSDTLNQAEAADIERLIHERLLRVTEKLKEDQFDFVVFPDELFRNDYFGDEDAEAREKFGITNAGTLIRAYRALAKDLQSEVLAHFPTLTEDGKRYTSGVLFAPDGAISDIYNKRYLAYSGEYWPFGDWQPPYAEEFKKIYPNIAKRTPVFDKRYNYDRGEGASPLILKGGVLLGLPICSEGHYPFYVKEFVNSGVEFIIHSSSNKWASLGLKKYLESLVWFRQVEAVWLGVPILVSGRQEYAGVVEPDGTYSLSDFENQEGFVVHNALIRL